MAKTPPNKTGLKDFLISFLLFIRQDFSLKKHVPVYLFVAVQIFALYYFDFAGWKKTLQLNTWQSTLFLLAGYSASFFIPFFWVLLCTKKTVTVRSLFAAFLPLALFAVASSWSLYHEFTFFSESGFHYWYRKSLSNITPFLLFLPFLLLFREVLFGETGSFLWVKTPVPWVRLILPLLVLSVLIVLAGSQAGDFGSSYPSFKYHRAAGEGIVPYLQVVSFELFYAIDFFTIELLCRGILVLGLLRYFGPHVILPMASFYVFIHYGKPLAETISSFFGGYVLGYLALYTRSILPGTLLHVTLAWAMEITAVVILGSY